MRTLSTTATHLVATLAVTAAAVLTAFALPLPARAMTITFGGDGGERVVGSGREAQVARPVGAFSALRLASSVDVDAHPGPHPGVTVIADDNIVPLIETVVEGDTLVVRTRKGAAFRTSHRMKVEVEFATLASTRQESSGDLRISALTAPRLQSVISGSGDLAIDDAALGSFAVDVAGSGDVRIAGHADEARYGVAGSGDIDAGRFVARRVSVAVSGSGDVRVNATDTLDARVAGSGDVTYLGHPHDVQRRVAGSGSIEAR